MRERNKRRRSERKRRACGKEGDILATATQGLAAADMLLCPDSLA